MKVWMRGRALCLHRLPAAVDVGEIRAGEAADHRVAGEPGDLADGLEIALGGDGKAGLDDVHAHLVEQGRDLELLVEGHGRAGRLLAVAQGGVEDQDVVLGWGLVGHCAGSSDSGLLRRFDSDPLSARAGPGRAQRPLRRSRPSGNLRRNASPSLVHIRAGVHIGRSIYAGYRFKVRKSRAPGHSARSPCRAAADARHCRRAGTGRRGARARFSGGSRSGPGTWERAKGKQSWLAQAER